MTILPNSDQVVFSDIAEAIRSAPSELFVSPDVSLRALLVERGPNDWVNFATVLHVGRKEASREPVDRRLRSIRLLAFSLTTAECGTPQSLAHALRLSQRTDGGAGETFQHLTHVYREHSKNRYTHREPCWRMDVHGQTPGVSDVRLPDGPYVGVAPAFQARSVAEAAAKWFDDPSMVGANRLLYVHRVVIPDGRAYLGTLNAVGNDLEVGIHGEARQPLLCSYHAQDLDGGTDEGVMPVTERRAVISFRRSVRTLELDLVDAESRQLDHYEENEFRGSWGATVYNEHLAASDAPHSELRQALERGEGEHIEFKPYVELTPRHPKGRELLESAVAFANASGGSIFIGVTDDARVEGIETRHLRKSLGPTVQGDYPALRDEYARLVRRVLIQGISPPLDLAVEGLTHAELWLLRVQIKPGTRKPYAIVEDGEVRVRRGATNRRLTPAEIRQLVRPDPLGMPRRP